MFARAGWRRLRARPEEPSAALSLTANSREFVDFNRWAVDERKTGAAGAAQLAGLQAAAAAAGVDTTSPSFAAAAEAAPAPAAAAAEELVCVSLVETATDEWCSSFCAKHSCPESMCKCEAAGAPPAQA